MKPIIILIVLLTSVFAMVSAIKRDIQIEKCTPPDLVNRVVGARLQKDGFDPYFYKWKPQDGERYYDISNLNSLTVSKCTATPFFHILMYPLIELPERKISQLWVGVEYALLLSMTLIAIVLVKSMVRKMALVVLSVSFLYTSGWIDHIAAGQNYLFIPFFALLFYFFWVTANRNRWPWLMMAGLCAISLLMIRPNTILFLGPFLLFNKYWVSKKTIAFYAPVFTLVALTIFSPFQRDLWTKYSLSVKEHTKNHQGSGAEIVYYVNLVKDKWGGGWDNDQVEKDCAVIKDYLNSQSASFYALFELLLGARLPVEVLFGILSILLLGIFCSFYFAARKCKYNLYNIVLLGWSLYMLSELLSPIYRYSYGAVLWIFPLIMAIVNFSRQFLIGYSLLFLGLVLNIFDFEFLKMEHTMGEYLWLVIFTIGAFQINKAKLRENDDIKELPSYA